MADISSPEQSMLKYVRSSSVMLTIFMLVFGAMSIALIIAGILKISDGIDSSASWVALPVGLFMMYVAFIPSLSYKKMINFLNNNGIYYEAVAEFPSAQSFFDDRIRLGNKYIFCRSRCAILRYYDICRVYQKPYYGGEIERRREFSAVDTSGKVWPLCPLKPDTDIQPGLDDVIDFMLSKNPGIKVDDRT